MGIVIGVMNLTGVGIRFASLIQGLSQGDLAISLILMAIACLILGMGMPTVPAYLVIVLVMGPALQKLGVATIPTHMFVLYFGVLSAVTPPVALAAFAAAPIAGARPMRTAIEAVRLAAPGFIIPFAFVYHPALLLVGDEGYIEIIYSIFLAILAVIAISRACYPQKYICLEIIAFSILAYCLLFAGTIIGLIAVVVIVIYLAQEFFAESIKKLKNHKKGEYNDKNLKI